MRYRATFVAGFVVGYIAGAQPAGSGTTRS